MKQAEGAQPKSWEELHEQDKRAKQALKEATNATKRET